MGSVVNSERMPNVMLVPIGTQAATIILPVGYFRKRTRLKAAMLNDQTGITADNSNYFVATLEDQSGSAPKVYASYDTRVANQGALTANVPSLMTLGGGSVLGAASGAVATTVLGDSTNPEVDVPAGSTLVLRLTLVGTKTFTKAVMQLEQYPL